MERIRDVGVIFDVDGVLIDSAAAHWESWRALAEELGQSLTHEAFAATFGRQNRDIVPLLFGETNPRAVEKLGGRKEEIYRDLVRPDPPIAGGAGELIRALHAEGYRLAVGSSGPRANIELVLNAMGALDHFSAMVCAEDVSRGKPDPQVFSLACERLNLPPNRCVVIEDAPAGVQAAKSAGAKAIAILMHHGRDAFPRADRVVETLGDITSEMVRSVLEY